MKFDNIESSNKYLENILNIIRMGIYQNLQKLKQTQREGLKTQQLVDSFNIIGTTSRFCEEWIGVQKEHERKDSTCQEDIYFYLNDDKHTRIFYAEAKRLPKYKSSSDEEYITGRSSNENPSGGIQRYKLGIHGSYDLKHNGIIAYVENKSIDDWISLINNKLSKEYPNDSLLVQGNNINEYTSNHQFINKEGYFIMNHFWINLTGKQ
ncbi:MAG: hypothetical protein M0O93_02590 [Bacteroidales bacterium]|nr:hypothetical protein [Bacteroidales bacterium]